MKITLSGAMRARDVSRPRDEQLAAAAEREAALDAATDQGPAGEAPADQADADGPASDAAAPTRADVPPAADDAPTPASVRRRRRRAR